MSTARKPKRTTIGKTVKEECLARNQCRYGLQGVRMRHEPTGREFECQGSEWGEKGQLLVYSTAEEMVYYPGKGPEEPFGLISLADIDLVNSRSSETVPAEECVILSEWPVVCCRPRKKHPKDWN